MEYSECILNANLNDYQLKLTDFTWKSQMQVKSFYTNNFLQKSYFYKKKFFAQSYFQGVFFGLHELALPILNPQDVYFLLLSMIFV